jgi:osmotically-inducible protein OsmY
LNTLHNDIDVSGAINVIVSAGVVDLWGGVETESERQTIRVAAEDTPGVSTVRDHIYVMPPALRHLLGADKSD